MPRVAIRFNRKRRALVNAPVVKKVLEDAMEQTIKPHYIKEFNKRVADWKHKPQFKARKQITTDFIKLDVFPTGAHTNLWIWTSRGTKPHTIKPVKAPYLRFQLQYNARTQPIDRYGVGDGKAHGDLVATLSVRHPGTKARKFEESITDQQKTWFAKQIDNAFRRGIRGMQK